MKMNKIIKEANRWLMRQEYLQHEIDHLSGKLFVDYLIFSENET